MFHRIVDCLKSTLGIHILDVKAYGGYLILFEPFFFKALFEVKQVLDGVLLVIAARLNVFLIDSEAILLRHCVKLCTETMSCVGCWPFGPRGVWPFTLRQRDGILHGAMEEF